MIEIERTGQERMLYPLIALTELIQNPRASRRPAVINTANKFFEPKAFIEFLVAKGWKVDSAVTFLARCQVIVLNNVDKFDT